MIDKKHLFQDLDTGNLNKEMRSRLFREAPTAKTIPEPKPIRGEVDQPVSDLQHMVGTYYVVNTPDNFQGGKRLFEKQTKITSGPRTLKQVKGYKLEFSAVPQQVKMPRNIPFSSEEKIYVQKEIDIFFNIGIIEKANDHTCGYISNIFIKPKKDGRHRIILNLIFFNNDIEHIHFKMDTLKSAIHLTKKNCYFTSIDLKDAYYSFAVHPSDRKYLQFFWKKSVFNLLH